MIKVKLMKYTAEPERTVAMAARLCYSPAGAEELSEKMTDEQVTKLVEKIISMGHASTMEHVTFTFAIEGIITTIICNNVPNINAPIKYLLSHNPALNIDSSLLILKL